MKIGSLFSGAGGLDLAVEAVFGATTVWQCEQDKAAAKVLAYHWPNVPNLGDITAVDWNAVKPVDILCGGFPCQDVSAAGKRAGIKDGTRSGLWAVFAEAIDALRPRDVIIENVRGLLSATAHRAVESDDAVVGDGSDRPVLRALGAVLGDLSDLGYDAVWTTLAAASVGSPHRRERVFIVASVADATQDGLSGQGLSGRVDAAQPKPGRSDVPLRAVSGDASHSPRYGRDEGRPESARLVGGFDAAVSGDEFGVALLPTPRTQDGANNGGPSQFQRNTLPLNAEVTLLPTPNASDGSGGGQHPDKREGHSRQLIDYVLAPSHWGKYAPAIARWEQIVGPAPAPTEPNKNGNPRLSAAFSEWLMGWPAGWVTDPAIGISRNDQLRILGNGVVVQQAIAALRYLLSVTKELEFA